MIDRLKYAKQLSRGKQVVDIGGARMNPEGSSLFDRCYIEMCEEAKTYTVIDQAPTANIQMDLNNPHTLSTVLAEADLVLCMETLEHLRNPGLVCEAIYRSGVETFITLPRTTLFYRHIERHGLASFWDSCDHLYAFDTHHAHALMKHNFPGRTYRMFRCLGQYMPAWPAVWLATLGKGLSIGIHIEPTQTTQSQNSMVHSK